MDHTTISLINAIEFALVAGKVSAPDGNAGRWTFQEGSEIHLVLVEALQDARIATGMDKANSQPTIIAVN